MSSLSNRDFYKELKENKISDVYLFYGDETFEKKKALKRLIKVISNDASCDITEYENDTFSINDIEALSGTFSLFGEKKVFILRDVNILSLDKGTLDRLYSVIENASGYMIVFIYISLDVDIKNPGWKKLVSFIEKNGTAVKSLRIDRSGLVKLMCDSAKKYGCELSARDAEYVIDSVGNDAENLLSEIAKLCMYTESGEITKDTIDMLICKSTQASVFELSKAVLAGNSTKAYKLISSYAEQRIDPITILSNLSMSFVDLYRAKAAVTANMKSSDMITAFGYKKNVEFRATNAMRDCSRYSLSQLRKIIGILTHADAEMKSAKTEPMLILEKTVSEIIRLQ